MFGQHLPSQDNIKTNEMRPNITDLTSTGLKRESGGAGGDVLYGCGVSSPFRELLLAARLLRSALQVLS